MWHFFLVECGRWPCETFHFVLSLAVISDQSLRPGIWILLWRLFIDMATDFVWSIAFVWRVGIVATVQMFEFATYMANPKHRESKYYIRRINSMLIQFMVIKAIAAHVMQICSFSLKYYCAVRSRSVNFVHKLSILIDRLSCIPIRTVYIYIYIYIYFCKVGHSWQIPERIRPCVNVDGRHFEHSNCP
jgi:hypothetical protein